MNSSEDRFLIYRARNLAIALDEKQMPMEASLVNEMINHLDKPNVITNDEQVIIEKPVFKNLLETSFLFMFLIDNIGRISLSHSGDRMNPKFEFVLNPPGRRQQFLREDVINALIEVRERMKTPQYG